MYVTEVVRNLFARIGHNGYDWELTPELLSFRLIKLLKIIPDSTANNFRRCVLVAIVNERLGMRAIATACSSNFADFDTDICTLLENNDVLTLMNVARKYFADVKLNVDAAMTDFNVIRSGFELKQFRDASDATGDIRQVYVSCANSVAVLRNTHITFITKQLDLQLCLLRTESVIAKLRRSIQELSDEVVSRGMITHTIKFARRQFTILCFDDRQLREVVSEAVHTEARMSLE